MIKQFLLELALRVKQKSMKVDEHYRVEDYLKRIPEYFDPEKAKDRKLVVVYEFQDSGQNSQFQYSYGFCRPVYRAWNGWWISERPMKS